MATIVLVILQQAVRQLVLPTRFLIRSSRFFIVEIEENFRYGHGNRSCKIGIRNMFTALSDHTDDLLEKHLLAQLSEIDVGIARLTDEKGMLQRLIIRAREQRIKPNDVTRRNSFDRIIIEDKILDILKKYNTHVFGRYLFKEIKGIVPGINKSTFRSHLHRMKSKGVIKPSESRGFWLLP